jgi:hypothetical protein
LALSLREKFAAFEGMAELVERLQRMRAEAGLPTADIPGAMNSNG